MDAPFGADTALLLIDVQAAFDDHAHWGGNRNNPDAEVRLAELLAAWRARGWPVVHVVHDSQEPDSPIKRHLPGGVIKDAVAPQPGEPVVVKRVNSAFIGTDLDADLRRAGIRRLVIGGLTTDHCVSTSVRMAGNLGYDVTLLADGTATFDRRGPDGTLYPSAQVHAISLATLHGEFCAVLDTQAVLARVKVAEQHSDWLGPEESERYLTRILDGED